MIPLSLYIHIPWCEKKCPYCDFNSHLANTEINEPDYVNALLADLKADLTLFSQSIQDRTLSSIFIGGGTPSLFSEKSISAILDGVAKQIAFSENIEITLEANPGSAEAGKFQGFQQAGVNRLSIGVQSFNQTHLKALGRIHSNKEAVLAAGFAVEAGFENFNLDLMFGLPSQTLEQALSDVKQAIELQPSHLSCYQLTIEPNTLFHHQPPITPNDETLWEMQNDIQSALALENYQQYEVSAYSLINRQCKHNLNYWQFGDYLGIGAGAHGKITNVNGQVIRNWKIKHPNSYLQRATDEKPFSGANNEVKQDQLPFEFMLNALRLSDGFKLELFEQRTGLPLSTIEKQLSKHQQQNLISIEAGELLLKKRGKSMLNELLQDYLPD